MGLGRVARGPGDVLASRSAHLTESLDRVWHEARTVTGSIARIDVTTVTRGSGFAPMSAITVCDCSSGGCSHPSRLGPAHTFLLEGMARYATPSPGPRLSEPRSSDSTLPH
jgi:hypothetical protein